MRETIPHLTREQKATLLRMERKEVEHQRWLKAKRMNFQRFARRMAIARWALISLAIGLCVWIWLTRT